MAIQYSWNLDPNVHWNATGERIVGNQCFQCASCGPPAGFRCVPIMQINTGLPLGYHRVHNSENVLYIECQQNSKHRSLPQILTSVAHTLFSGSWRKRYYHIHSAFIQHEFIDNYILILRAMSASQETCKPFVLCSVLLWSGNSCSSYGITLLQKGQSHDYSRRKEVNPDEYG